MQNCEQIKIDTGAKAQGRWTALGWTFLFVALGCSWLLYSGKDWNWDLINYHFYGPDLLFRDRWRKDFFAASIQSYLNPIAYVPFYLLVKFEVPDLIIGGLLATLQSVNIFFIWRLSRAILPAAASTSIVAVATLLASVAPLFLAEFGSTFNDVLTSILVLWALELTISCQSKPASTVWKTLFSIGLLLGIATGLKLTNMMFVVSLGATVLYVLIKREDARHLTSGIGFLTIGLATGFLVTHGYWSWKLWTEFGSPFFPFFNGIFKAEGYPSVNIRDIRFMGGGALGVLTMPFEMARSEGWIYAESPAPDIRFGFLMVVAFAATLRSILEKLFQKKANAVNQKLLAVAFFFISSYIVWMFISRIGRYAMPLWLLIGPLFVTVAFLRFNKRIVFALSLGLVLMQIGVSELGRLSKWDPVDWSGKWFDFDLPMEITSEAVRLITTDNQTMAAIVPSLNSKSSVTNIVGQYALGFGGDTPPRLKELLSSTDARPLYLMRTISLANNNPNNNDVEHSNFRWANETIAPYGLTINEVPSCIYGALKGKQAIQHRANELQVGYKLLFCKLHRIPLEKQTAAETYTSRFDKIFEFWEKLCPSNFSPRGTNTTIVNGVLARTYFNTSNELYVVNETMYASSARSLEANELPKLNIDMASPENVQCPPMPKRRYLK